MGKSLGSLQRIPHFFSVFTSSLKGRLIIGVSVLVILALAVSDIVGIIQLRSYLTKRIDGQINSALVNTSRLVERQSGQLFSRPLVVRRSEPGAQGAGIQAPSPVLIVVYGPTGSINFTRYDQLGSVQEPVIPSLTQVTRLSRGRTYFHLQSARGDSMFIARIRPLPRDLGTVMVAVSLDELNSTISRLRFLDLVVGAIVLGLLVAMIYLVVRIGMRPLAEMERTAEAIAKGDLSLRIDHEDAASEIGRLGSAFNEMLIQIQEAFIQVQQSEQMSKNSQDQLRRFVADAGHELRTPLTSIMGYSELLQHAIEVDWDLVKRSAKRIQQESSRMSGLVEELLLLASLDQKKSLRSDRVDVLPIVADCVQDAKVIQPQRDIRLEPFDSSAGGGWSQPLFIEGDEQYLRQVVTNLVNNALSHTPIEAAIIVRTGLVCSDRGSNGNLKVAIEVQDFGPGIKRSALEHLFERFYRVDDNRGFEHGGFGLGLSVVESVVRAHGGTVSVESVEGEGSCFRVELPLRNTTALVEDVSGV